MWYKQQYIGKKQANKIPLMPNQSTQNCWKIAYLTAKPYSYNKSVCHSKNLSTQRKWLVKLNEQQIDKTNLQEREQILKEKKKDAATTIPSLLKYNRMHPKIKEVVMEHWHPLHVNPNLVHNLAKCLNVCLQTKWMWVRVSLQLHLAKIFQNPPLLSFCWRLQRLYWYQIN